MNKSVKSHNIHLVQRLSEHTVGVIRLYDGKWLCPIIQQRLTHSGGDESRFLPRRQPTHFYNLQVSECGLLTSPFRVAVSKGRVSALRSFIQSTISGGKEEHTHTHKQTNKRLCWDEATTILQRAAPLLWPPTSPRRYDLDWSLKLLAKSSADDLFL